MLYEYIIIKLMSWIWFQNLMKVRFPISIEKVCNNNLKAQEMW